MDSESFEDPVVELNRLTGGAPEDVVDLAGMTDDQARDTIEEVKRIQAAARAGEIKDQLRNEGHYL